MFQTLRQKKLCSLLILNTPILFLYFFTLSLLCFVCKMRDMNDFSYIHNIFLCYLLLYWVVRKKKRFFGSPMVFQGLVITFFIWMFCSSLPPPLSLLLSFTLSLPPSLYSLLFFQNMNICLYLHLTLIRNWKLWIVMLCDRKLIFNIKWELDFVSFELTAMS